MSDRFFAQTACDRCGGPLSGGRIMSMFNTDCICMECAGRERARADYGRARDVEARAVRDGDRNFRGVGL